MSYTTSAPPYQIGPGMQNDSVGMIFEDVKVVGSGDTSGNYTAKFVKQPQRIEGPFTLTSISGQVVTFGSASLTGTEYMRIIGFA